MADESIGEQVKVHVADHPPRSDSPEYNRTRKTLMADYGGGCFICDGPVDLSHPGVADSKGLQDHHGGGIYAVLGDKPVLIGLSLLQLEWSEGWGADPVIVQRMVQNQNAIAGKLGAPTYDKPITDDASVMDYVDSIHNANVKLCAVHHIGHTKTRSKDSRGHEGVGIHNVPMPIFMYQLSCDWEHWDMFAGGTGDVAVAPDPQKPGHARLLYIDPDHEDQSVAEPFATGNQVSLAPSHPFARRAALTEKYR